MAAAPEETVGLARCEVYDERLKRELQRWAAAMGDTDEEKRPLVLVAVGRGGAGKSTLVNNLLELGKGDEYYCDDGNWACAKTRTVKVCKKRKGSVEVHVIDTPGLGASIDGITPKAVIEELSEKTNKNADFLFYCVSLHPSAKPDSTDVKIVKLLTKAYGDEIWKRAFVVLTFANQCDKDGYDERIGSYEQKLSEILKKANVKIPVRALLPTEEDMQMARTHPSTAGFLTQDSGEASPPSNTTPPVQPASASNAEVFIPAIPVGNKDPILTVPCAHNWSERLFLEVLKRSSNVHTLNNLLALKGFTIKIEEVAGGAVGGAAIGGAVGGATGAAAGLGVGVIIGAPAGALAGGIGGAALAIAKAKLPEFRATHF